MTTAFPTSMSQRATRTPWASSLATALLAVVFAGCMATNGQQAATPEAPATETPEQVLASVSEDPSAGTNASADDAENDLGIVIPDEGNAAAGNGAVAASPPPAAAPSLPAEEPVLQQALPSEATTALAPESAQPAPAMPTIDPHPVPTAGAKHVAAAKGKGKTTAGKEPRSHKDLAAAAIGSVGERVLRYVAKEDAKIFSSTQASADVLGRLDRGERVFVVIEEGGWGRVAGDRFVKLADLSATGVARQHAKAAWQAAGEATP